MNSEIGETQRRASVCFQASAHLAPSAWLGSSCFSMLNCQRCLPNENPRLSSSVKRIRRPPRARLPRLKDREPNEQWTPEKLGFLHIATLTGAHGVKGAIKVRAEGDFAKTRLGPGVHTGKRYLLLPGRRYPRPIKVLAGTPASQPGFWIIKIDGVKDRDEVDRLRGSRLFVKDRDRPKLQREEYMVSDLVGCKVVLVTDDEAWYTLETRLEIFNCGAPIGVIDSVITRQDLCEASGGGQQSAAVAADLVQVATFEVDESLREKLRIESEDIPEGADRSLVPFVKEIVPIVDLKRGVVVLNPPEGLLTITRVHVKDKPKPPRGLLMAARD